MSTANTSDSYAEANVENSSASTPDPQNCEAADTPMDILQDCLKLAKEAETEAIAKQHYQQLRDRLLQEQTDTQMLELLDMTWAAMLSSQRAANLWQRLFQTEQRMTDEMANNHIQLRQNHLRLIQEQ